MSLDQSVQRRHFLRLFAGSAIAWPFAAQAQQSPMPVVGFLGLTSPEAYAAQLSAFKQGLAEAGFADGHNVAIQYRWARGQFDQLSVLAADLVRQGVNVIAALGTPASAIAAKGATSTIPIVFVTGSDPIGMGLVDSLNRPTSNATGIYMLTSSLEPKRVELMREAVPNAKLIGVIVDPDSPDTSQQMKELPAAASVLGRQLKIVSASSGNDIDTAFATMADQKVGAVVVASSPIYFAQREKFVGIAARYAIPTVYFVRDFADAGGLMSYGTSFIDANRQAGLYTGRILKGDKVADLPVQQSVKVELVINLKTAKALGLSMPLPLLGRADAIIE
jgi:putative tryptophan/tyrosine transport system substrate-binding protein